MTVEKRARKASRGGSVVGGDKPPYSVPSMVEVNKVPWNGLRVASTFSGCGGSSLGFRMAGYHVAWANEFVDEARVTYEANKSPWTAVDGRDIREVKASDIRAATAGLAEVDVLEGSPPCSSFSMAGNRERGWGQAHAYSDGKVQRTDDLFAEYSRILRELRPRAFVAENVAGLALGEAKGHYYAILDDLRSCGYRVAARLLDAQWLGVPQQRRRIIFVGFREDLDEDPAEAYPKPLTYRYSIGEALSGIVELPPREASFVGMAIGREWGHLRPGEASTRYFSLIRTNPRLPCPTVTAEVGNTGAAAVAHYSEPRKFSVPELKRICSFPDDFVLTGNYRQQCERMGRSVPPLMMRAVARKVAEVLLRHC